MQIPDWPFIVTSTLWSHASYSTLIYCSWQSASAADNYTGYPCLTEIYPSGVIDQLFRYQLLWCTANIYNELEKLITILYDFINCCDWDHDYNVCVWEGRDDKLTEDCILIGGYDVFLWAIYKCAQRYQPPTLNSQPKLPADIIDL